MLVLALGVLAGIPAWAQDQAIEEEMSPADRRIYQAYTRLFCQQFFQYDGYKKYVILPNYVRDREASTGKTYDQVFEEMSYTETRSRGGIARTVTIRPPRGEALAASMVIPDIDVGHYGYLNSAVIRQVVSPNEMIVVDIQFINPEAEFIKNEPVTYRKALAQKQKQFIGRTYRVCGFDTEGLEAGSRWYGPENKGIHIAVAGTDREHRFVLVNFDRLRRIRTTEFDDVLAYVHLTPSEFNAMTRANREEHRTDGDKQTLIAIYKLYYNRFRIPRERIAQAPATRPDPVEEVPRVGTPEIAHPEPPAAPPPADPDPKSEAQPERPVVPEERPAPEPKPDVRQAQAEEEEDDWDEKNPGPSPDVPTFFGIPID